jgi:hypothetical protein
MILEINVGVLSAEIFDFVAEKVDAGQTDFIAGVVVGVGRIQDRKP